MNAHLSPDEIADAVEGTLAPNRQKHVEVCASCREQAVRLTAILRETHDTGIPEPSPMFWDRFSARVQAAIDREEAPEARPALQWFRWPVLAPLAGLVLVVLALAVALPRPADVPDAAAALDAVAGDANDLALFGGPEWNVVSAIVGAVDIDRAPESGIVVRPGDVERAALELSAAEQQELLRLVKEEIEKAGG